MSVRARRVRIAGEVLHGEVPDRASRTAQRGASPLFARLPLALLVRVHQALRRVCVLHFHRFSHRLIKMRISAFRNSFTPVPPVR